MAQPDANGGPIVVSQEVYDGIEAVRQAGVVNMLDRPSVVAVARLMGHDTAALWIRENPGLYS